MFNYSKYELFMKQTAVHESKIDYDVKSTIDVFDFAVQIMELNNIPQEVFAIITVDTKGKIIGFSEISRGRLMVQWYIPVKCSSLLLFKTLLR